MAVHNREIPPEYRGRRRIPAMPFSAGFRRKDRRQSTDALICAALRRSCGVVFFPFNRFRASARKIAHRCAVPATDRRTDRRLRTNTDRPTDGHRSAAGRTPTDRRTDTPAKPDGHPTEKPAKDEEERNIDPAGDRFVEAARKTRRNGAHRLPKRHAPPAGAD